MHGQQNIKKKKTMGMMHLKIKIQLFLPDGIVQLFSFFCVN